MSRVFSADRVEMALFSAILILGVPAVALLSYTFA